MSTKVHESHSYLTRSHTSNTLAVPNFNSNSGLRTFHVRAAYVWNNLPSSVRTKMTINMSVNQFKSKIHQIYYVFFLL